MTKTRSSRESPLKCLVVSRTYPSCTTLTMPIHPLTQMRWTMEGAAATDTLLLSSESYWKEQKASAQRQRQVHFGYMHGSLESTEHSSVQRLALPWIEEETALAFPLVSIGGRFIKELLSITAVDTITKTWPWLWILDLNVVCIVTFIKHIFETSQTRYWLLKKLDNVQTGNFYSLTNSEWQPGYGVAQPNTFQMAEFNADLRKPSKRGLGYFRV